MQTLHGTRAVITGAASGIGKAIAAALARAGARLVLVDLQPAALAAAAADLRADGADVAHAVCDVTDPVAVRALRDVVCADGPIDVLVNNAGVVFGGAFLDVPLEKHDLTYRVNAIGVVSMTHAFLPALLQRPAAHLVNIASASGYIGLPFGTTYASSKWAVIGFSESLEEELRLLGHEHVRITTVCPSYVDTGMFHGVRPPLTTALLTPEGLAEMVVHALLHDLSVVRTPWLVKLTPLLKALTPPRVFSAVAGWLGVNTSMLHWRGRGDTAPAAGDRDVLPPPQAGAA